MICVGHLISSVLAWIIYNAAAINCSIGGWFLEFEICHLTFIVTDLSTQPQPQAQL